MDAGARWCCSSSRCSRASTSTSLDPAGPDFIHCQVECAKLAFADRETFYGDPKFVEVPIETLLSDAYNDERRKLITERGLARAAARHDRGLRQDDGAVRLADGARAAVARSGAGEPTVGASLDARRGELPDASRKRASAKDGAVPGDTVHFDIIDRDGNMVSSTPSGGWLHSSPVIPELGFCLGTRAQMFWLEEGHPASLAPGKRPRSTLTPTMALRDGEPYLAWGSPGGDQQDQWITQFFLRHVHAGMNLQEAIDAPAWHTEHFLVLVLAAHRAPRRARGREPRAEGDARRTRKARPQGRGRSRLVRRAPHRGRRSDGKRRKAAANPRGMQGYAAGR